MSNWKDKLTQLFYIQAVKPVYRVMFEHRVAQFITDLRKHDEEELIKIIGTFTPTCGYESEEEKGYQKGIQAEQSLIKKNIKDYYAK